MTRKKHSRGFSLIEMMVAVVIALFILGGLVALMASSRKSYEVQDYSARLQENARFAMDFLSYDLRMAGYFGCSQNIVNDPTAAGYSNPIEPAAVNGSGSVSDSFSFVYADPRDNDMVIESVADIAGSPNVWILNKFPDEWTTSAAIVGTPIVVSDCGSSSITTVTAANVGQREITVDPSIGRVFDPSRPLQIGVRRLNAVTYTIVTGAAGIPALERNGVELVEGIENLQFLFQTVGGGAFETGGGTISGRLAAIKYGVLARSVSNAGDSNKEYGGGSAGTVDEGLHTLLDTNLNVGTLRGQRRTFSSTVLVRNSNL